MSKTPNNIQYHCVSCHTKMDEGRAKRREALGAEALCVSCAKAHTQEYIGASIKGDLIKTNNSRSIERVKTYHKGSHAIQG